MHGESDHVLVEGNFIVDRRRSDGGGSSGSLSWHNQFTAGTIEVKGNFTQKSTYSGEYSSYANGGFAASGTHRVVLSGNTKQTVSFEDPGSHDRYNSHFNILDVRNTSSEGVEFATKVVVLGELAASGCAVPLSLVDVTYTTLNLDTSCSPADLDGDGIADDQDPDIDGDGVPNEQDAFPRDASESVDTDGDGIGNNADLDDDGDGISDADEIANGLNPLDPTDADQDNDHDGVSNKDEINAGTDPNSNEAILLIQAIDDITTFVGSSIPDIMIEANASNGVPLEYAAESNNTAIVLVNVNDENLSFDLVAAAPGSATVRVTASLGDKNVTDTFEVKAIEGQIRIEDDEGNYHSVDETTYAIEGSGVQLHIRADEAGLNFSIHSGVLQTDLHVTIPGATIQIDHNHNAEITLPTGVSYRIAIDADGTTQPHLRGALLPVDPLPLGTQVEAGAQSMTMTVPLRGTMTFRRQP